MDDISPDLFMDAVLAYQQTAAIKAGLELDLFSNIGEGHETAESLARKTGAAVRGIRILCDYLTARGHLEKHGDQYRLSLQYRLPARCSTSPPDMGCSASRLRERSRTRRSLRSTGTVSFQLP